MVEFSFLTNLSCLHTPALAKFSSKGIVLVILCCNFNKYRTNGSVEGYLPGKNPINFREAIPKPFLGAHFAVYPEALCVLSISSSGPLGRVVLDLFVGS